MGGYTTLGKKIVKICFYQLTPSPMRSSITIDFNRGENYFSTLTIIISTVVFGDNGASVVRGNLLDPGNDPVLLFAISRDCRLEK